MLIKYCDDALILYREELLLVASIMEASKRLPADVLEMIFESLLEPSIPLRYEYKKERERRKEACKLCLVDKSTAVVAQRMLYRTIAMHDYEMTQNLAKGFESKSHLFRHTRELWFCGVACGPFPFDDPDKLFKAIRSLDHLVIDGMWADVFKSITFTFSIHTLTIVGLEEEDIPDLTNLDVNSLHIPYPSNNFMKRLRSASLNNDTAAASSIRKIRSIPRISFTLLECSKFEVDVFSQLFRNQSRDPLTASLWVKSYYERTIVDRFVIHSHWYDYLFSPYRALEFPMRAIFVENIQFDVEASLQWDIHDAQVSWNWVVNTLDECYEPGDGRNVLYVSN